MTDNDVTPEQASHGRVIPDRDLPMVAAQWLVDATTRHFCGRASTPISVAARVALDQDDFMEWDDATRERLEMALNESEVVGIRVDPDGRHVDVLLHVIALPKAGPLLKDGRRIMRLTRPAELRFLLRRDPIGEQVATQPAIPLADEAAVEALFESLAWGGSVYGWRFFDDPELTSDWPVESSLHITLRDDASAHTFYWFNECGVEREGETETFCIEGTVVFDELVVLDAAEREVPIDTFIADGVRQWDALYTHDPRLSVEA